MTDVVDLGVVTDSALAIGGPNDLLFVGQSFDRTYAWLEPADDCADPEQPLNFTGFTIAAEILDSTNAVIGTFAVDSSVGDATASVDLHLDPGDTTTTLRDNAVKWQIRAFNGGTVNNILIYVEFKVT